MASLLRGTKSSFSVLSGCNKLGINYSVRTFTGQDRKIVRRHVKPLHIPVSRSRLFRIDEPPYVPPDEKKLMEELEAEYTRRMTSLRQMCRKEYEKTSDTSAFAAAAAEVVEKEHQQLMELNRQENERVRLIREETLEREFQEKITMLMEQYEEMEREKEAKKMEIQGAIEKAKEESGSYITHETLEQAIELALDNPVNHNFCIDLNGQKYWEAEPVEAQESESLSV